MSMGKQEMLLVQLLVAVVAGE